MFNVDNKTTIGRKPLKKTHPKSNFMVFDNDPMELQNPTIFDYDKEKLIKIVFLQVMPIGEDELLVEYISKDIFEKDIQKETDK